MTRILTLPETAKLLQVHVSTVYRMLKKREIPAFKIGSDWRFALDDLQAWMKQNEVSR